MGFSIEDYSSDYLQGKVYSKYQTTSVDTNVSENAQTSYLDFEGYLKLLSAQMANQDFNNAMSDSEFIQQMASYSMMDAISQLTKQNNLSYSASLIGKAVTVEQTPGIPETGIVEAVSVTDEGCKVLVNGGLCKVDSITDVVDGTVYKQLSAFIGQKVEVKDKDQSITGTVHSILIKNGEGYLTLRNSGNFLGSYKFGALVRVIDDNDTGDGGENTEGGSTEGENTEGVSVENTENTGNTESSSEENSAEVEAQDANAKAIGETAGTVYSSKAAYEALMEMVDGTQGNDYSAVDASLKSARVKSSLDKMSSYLTTSVNTSPAASGLANDIIPAPYSGYGYTDNSNMGYIDDGYVPGVQGSVNYSEPVLTEQSIGTASASVNNLKTSVPRGGYSAGYDKGEVSGVTNVSGSEAESTSLESFASGNINGSVPRSSRKYADGYPYEAAFADSVGTKMGDIRFIGNTKINSRIDTSKIICYSEKGRAVTDIGWCGKGRLGEVVTFADGTQRVEIIGPTEVSYLYTSGNLTLDEICDYNCAPGALVGKLTPFETAIRHYAREYTPAEQQEMRDFEQYVRGLAASQRI